MAYPEKTARNDAIFYQHLSGSSYREILKDSKLKSVKSVYRIVSRLRKRHKNAKAFISTYEKKMRTKGA